MYKAKSNIATLLTLVFFSMLVILLFACKTSNEKERQITNAFTPGQTTEEPLVQSQLTDEIETPAESDLTTTENPLETTVVSSLQPNNTSGLPAVVTQTRAATQPNQPALTNTATKKPANTATATVKPSNTATVTLTPSPTLQTGWAGDWNVFWQLDNNNYVEGTISVELAGTDFTASGTVGGIEYSFTGRIIYDGETAFGNWASPTRNGNFIWNKVGEGQFGGSRDTYFGFCGAREGVVPPNPCYVPPLS